MSLTAALRGFVAFLCWFSATQSEEDWKVRYRESEICAVKGSTLLTWSAYDYPEKVNAVRTTVEKRFWFITTEGEPVDLNEDPEYKGRVTYKVNGRYHNLKISELRESDSAVYKFRFITNHEIGRYTGYPGVRLTVEGLQVVVQQKYSDLQLKCSNRCDPNGFKKYVWFKNGQETRSETSQTFTYRDSTYSTVRISCALSDLKTHQSPEVYVPHTPSVSLDPPTEILEGTSVTLTCSTDANPAAKYSWFKKTNSSIIILSTGPHFVWNSIQSTDSGDYYCKVENQLGFKTSDFKLEVKYSPKNIFVSVSPTEILEGSPVTLTCSSDANPAAKYTWFKAKNHLNAANVYHLPSININDSGIYVCKSENKHGWINSSVHIDVLYAPKFPSASINGSGQILEGSSVTLTCSSDANPAAEYTWFKENKDSPTSEEQMFIISDITADDGGLYICVAQNKLGQQNSTVHVSVASGSLGLAAALLIPAFLLTLIFLIVLFLKVFRRPSKEPLVIRSQDEDPQKLEGSGRDGLTSRHPAEDQAEIQYATVTFTKRQEDPLYSNIDPVKAKRRRDSHEDKEDVVYSLVGSSAVYSVVGSSCNPAD